MVGTEVVSRQHYENTGFIQLVDLKIMENVFVFMGRLV